MKARETSIPIIKLVEKDESFFHYGKVGGWSNNVTADMDAKMDTWITENFRDYQDICLKYASAGKQKQSV